ncbi:hypothetical protein ACWPKO_19650 (plasmid) [Coraliomargarita sp. W4R53]
MSTPIIAQTLKNHFTGDVPVWAIETTLIGTEGSELTFEHRGEANTIGNLTVQAVQVVVVNGPWSKISPIEVSVTSGGDVLDIPGTEALYLPELARDAVGKISLGELFEGTGRSSRIVSAPKQLKRRADVDARLQELDDE